MSESTEQLFPIHLVYHGNLYSGTLYDVDGNILRNEAGEKLNVFKEQFKDLLEDKQIRFMHYLTKEPTYSYFVTSTEQLERFHVERAEGSYFSGISYHVYPDL